MKIKQAFTENLGMKVLALIVALFIWFNVSSQEEMTRLFTLPVQLEGIPDSLTVTGNLPADVKASITASKRQILYMGFRKGFVSVNLAGATSGHYRQALSPSNVMLPSGVRPYNVRIIAPTSIDLYFARKVTRSVPVVLTLTGSIPEGYVLLGVPEVTQRRVEVTGAEGYVKHLKNIPTKPLDLGKIKESQEKELELEFDRSLFTCHPDRVKVVFVVSPRSSRALANIPPTILVDEGPLAVEADPKTVSLMLEGPKTILDTLTSRDVSVLIDLSGRKPGRYKTAPEVIVPDGIEKFELNVDSIAVEITRPKAKKSDVPK